MTDRPVDGDVTRGPLVAFNAMKGPLITPPMPHESSRFVRATPKVGAARAAGTTSPNPPHCNDNKKLSRWIQAQRPERTVQGSQPRNRGLR
jgi:hypothetical protein